MKRAIIALAIASLSFAAFAVPPGPPGSVDVNVTNPVVPVDVTNSSLDVNVKNTVLPIEVSNADPILVVSPIQPLGSFVAKGAGFGVAPGGGLNAFSTFGGDIVATGLLLQLTASGTTGECSITVGLADEEGNSLFLWLAYGLVVRGGENLTLPMIPLPNLEFPAGTRLTFTGSNGTNGDCGVRYTLHGRTW